MESLGEVRITVGLHRQGWGQKPEVVLKRSRGRLYRTRTQHIILGHSWSRIKPLVRQAQFWWGRAPLAAPLLWPRPAYGKIRVFPPGRKFPFVVLFQDRSVKACRREGQRVTLYATELKEFTDFVLGKLTATIEFQSEASAEAFAQNFTTISDPSAIDSTVTVNVDRTKGSIHSRRRISGLVLSTLALVGLFLLGVFLSVWFNLPSTAASAFLVPGMLLIVFAMVSLARGYRKDYQDYLQKWPQQMFDTWISQFELRTAAFPQVAKELGIALSADSMELAPLDSYLRGLPPDSFHGALALDAGGLTGAILLQRIGRRVKFEWRYHPGVREPVLFFEPISYIVFPVRIVRSVWVEKNSTGMDRAVDELARRAQFRLAFQSQPEFIALGFSNVAWEKIEELTGRIEKDVESDSAKLRILGEKRCRVRYSRYGQFEVQFVEVETGPDKFQPLVAIPFINATQTLQGQLEASSPKSPLREDVAILRFQGLELVPLGVQVYNYLDLDSSFLKRMGPIQVGLSAVVDSCRVLGPRMLDQTVVKDVIGPLTPSDAGLSLNPYAQFQGTITAVGELTNPFSGTVFWRLGLDFSGFKLEAFVRKDKCDGVPQTGHHLAGTVWLVGIVQPGPETPSEYIT